MYISPRWNSFMKTWKIWFTLCFRVHTMSSSDWLRFCYGNVCVERDVPRVSYRLCARGTACCCRRACFMGTHMVEWLPSSLLFTNGYQTFGTVQKKNCSKILTGRTKNPEKFPRVLEKLRFAIVVKHTTRGKKNFCTSLLDFAKLHISSNSVFFV